MAMNCILKNFWMIFWVVDVVRPVGAIIGWMRKAMRGEGTGRTTPFYNLSHELIVDETDEVWGVVHLCLLGGRCSGSQWTRESFAPARRPLIVIDPVIHMGVSTALKSRRTSEKTRWEDCNSTGVDAGAANILSLQSQLESCPVRINGSASRGAPHVWAIRHPAGLVAQRGEGRNDRY